LSERAKLLSLFRKKDAPMKYVLATVAIIAGGSPLAASEELWRDCRTCHQVAAPDGTVLARGGRAGPNLYGIAGRPLASESGYDLYSQDLTLAGATGVRWTRDNFVAYLANPDQFLSNITGSDTAESAMHVAQPADGAALFDYLQELSN
jgi:cytochrome c